MFYISQDCEELKINDGAIYSFQERGDLVAINNTALRIMERIREKWSLETLILELAREYDVSVDKIRVDTYEAIEKLTECGILKKS